MQTIKEWSPTGFDYAIGVFGPLQNKQYWLVLPVIQTRDSGVLERSNFQAALALLGGGSESVEVHRFGHWGPGWYEIIIVAPSLIDKAQEIEDRLNDYPILDEDLHSRLEDEECEQVWSNSYDEAKRVEYLREHVSLPCKYPPYGMTAYQAFRAAVKGDWAIAANLLPCPSDLIY